MGFINDLFSTEKSVSCDFRNLVISQSSTGAVIKTYSATTDLTVNALMWVGSAVDKVVSEKIRADVEAVLVIDYEDYSSTIDEDAKVIIGDKEYSVIYVENIANQNKVIQIPLKRFS